MITSTKFEVDAINHCLASIIHVTL